MLRSRCDKRRSTGAVAANCLNGREKAIEKIGMH
jgi:hypothetical protein